MPAHETQPDCAPAPVLQITNPHIIVLSLIVLFLAFRSLR